MRYELTDDEWFAIRAMLPNKAARCASRERPPKREWYLLSSAIWRNLARSARSWKLRAKDVGGLMLDAGADYETDLASAKGARCYPDERSAFPPGSLRCRRSKSHDVSG